MEKTNIKHSKFNGPKPKQRVLVQSLTLLMPATILSSSLAATFEVNNPTDDGTGLVSGTLSAAILAANMNPGPDDIILTTDLQFTGVMKRLIDSDVTISGTGVRKIIDGNNQFRPLFIKSGQVMINNIELTHGGGIGLDDGAFGYGEYAGLAGNGGFGGAGGHANADEGCKTFAGHGGFG